MIDLMYEQMLKKIQSPGLGQIFSLNVDEVTTNNN
jgi:hypothetical protein